MMEKVELTCICCPLGCPLCVTIENGEVAAISGNTCPRGAAYGRKEVTHPTRIVTSTIAVLGGTTPRVSVKTQNDIPKEKIFDCMKALKTLVVKAPVRIGDVVLKDVAGCNVDIVATSNS